MLVALIKTGVLEHSQGVALGVCKIDRCFAVFTRSHTEVLFQLRAELIQLLHRTKFPNPQGRQALRSITQITWPWVDTLFGNRLFHLTLSRVPDALQAFGNAFNEWQSEGINGYRDATVFSGVMS